MKSPEKMRIIQIDITNACDKACSNCTRFCGNHKKPFLMTFETFKRAVDSLEGFPGTVGMMGGEPTLHPEFERFARYLASKYEIDNHNNILYYPHKEFMKAIQRREIDNLTFTGRDDVPITVIGPGLWSNMGASYKKHYEVISDSFPIQELNDHINTMYHQPILISRKDLEIPDDEWFKLRDACWVQNNWSATITPKGAFFCEIAGALDMLFDGTGGWPIEKDWWKRQPGDFADQLHWCEMCGLACNTFTRDASEEVDDVSPTLFEKLSDIGSPGVKKGRTKLVKIENGIIAEESKASDKRFSQSLPYVESYEARFNANNSVLFARGFEELIVTSEAVDGNNDAQFEKSSTICNGGDFGKKLYSVIRDAKEWIVVHSDSVKLNSKFTAMLEGCVLNQGTMHYLDVAISHDNEYIDVKNGNTVGFVALFNKNALSIREIGFDNILHFDSFDNLVSLWNPLKVIPLSSEIKDVTKRIAVIKGVKYAIWGAGVMGEYAYEIIQNSEAELAFVIDADPRKWGCDFHGYTIKPPDYLQEHLDEFEQLIPANLTHFGEIKNAAITRGVVVERITSVTNW